MASKAHSPKNPIIQFAALSGTIAKAHSQVIVLPWNHPCCHRWASASRKLTPASAFRHLSSQSGTGPNKCRTASLYSGTGTAPASLVFFSPVPDCLDAR
jgi:hypothetical protein